MLVIPGSLLKLEARCVEGLALVEDEPPNESRLSCGRLARRGTSTGRQSTPARGTTLRFH